MTQGPTLPQDPPEKTLHATPATQYDILLGIARNGTGGTWLRRQVEEWRHMRPEQRKELVNNVIAAPWLPRAAKDALRAAYE